MKSPACAALLLTLAAPVHAARPEDAAHRADRIATERLNSGAAALVARRDRGNSDSADAYRTARARYLRDMAAWRRNLAACERGDASACAAR